MNTIPAATRNWLNVIFKIIFCVVAFVLVVLTILTNMGGKSDPLKESIEQFIGQSTGYTAKIKTLNNMNYFPSVIVDFEDLDLYDKNGGSISKAHVDRLRMAFSFWDIFIRSGKIKVLDVIGVKVEPGAFFNFGKLLTLKSVSISDVSQSEAKLNGEGTLGANPLNFTVGMEIFGSGKGKKYRIDLHKPLDIKIGEVALTSNVQSNSDPNISFGDLKIAVAGKTVAEGNLNISKRRERELMIGGELRMADHGTPLHPDLVFDTSSRKFSGAIQSGQFDKRDFDAHSSFARLTDLLVKMLGDGKDDQKLLDDFFAAEPVTLDLKGKESYQGPLVFENNRLSLKAPAKPQ